jgi:ribosomal protein L23
LQTTVIYRPIHTEKDHQLMQEDLDTLVGWSDTWQMEFNVSKCTNERRIKFS